MGAGSRKNFGLATFVRVWMVAALCGALLVGMPVSPAHAATCTVTSVLDDGSAGTLRAAIADGSCDTITFDAGLSGATIMLASTLTLAHDVSIDGSALAAQVSISGGLTSSGGGVQVFYVDPGITANLKGLTITNGYTTDSGAGIYNAGTLTVTDSVVSRNEAVDYGGGIANVGTLVVTDSAVSNNGSGYGGGIYNAGILTVTGSTFSLDASNDGGAIYNTGMSAVTGSVFSDDGTNYFDTGNGGGIENRGSMTVTGSTFSGANAGLSGGGIENKGTLTVANSTFTGNWAGNVGGYDGTGGAIDNSGSLTVANSTFFDNSAGTGGGIFNGGTLTVVNSTFLDNSAIEGAISPDLRIGIGGNIANGGTMRIANTILAHFPNPWGEDCVSGGVISANINNLVQDGSCSQGGVKFKKGDPKLGALADNGGPTQTLALLPGSPAIHAGDDATCAAAPVNNLDQRGVARPGGLHCDIGAYELAPKERARNGGFNTYAGASKIPSGWMAVNFAASDGKFTAAKREGTASVLMAGRAGVTKTLKQTLVLSGVAGDMFSFSFWVRGAGIPAAGTCRAQVLLYNGAVLKSTKTVNCPVGTYAVFQNKTLNFTATSAFTEVVIKLSYAKAGGRVWFDAVSLIK